METPSTARKVTRSIPLSEKGVPKARQRSSSVQQQDRCVLDDISNDSPIVGVAKGKDNETPLWKQKRVTQTPGSGEALLRGQVKTLLQRVEEEAVAVIPPFQKLGDDSSMQVVNEIFEDESNQKAECDEKSVITRSLFLDFLDDKSEVSECSSEVPYQEMSQAEDDDGSSIWSVQVNASTRDDDVGLLLDELCDGLNNITVTVNEKKGCGKHTKFVYDSEDELVEKVVETCAEMASSDVLRLKGLPTPKGKHLRFPQD